MNTRIRTTRARRTAALILPLLGLGVAQAQSPVAGSQTYLSAAGSVSSAAASVQSQSYTAELSMTSSLVVASASSEQCESSGWTLAVASLDHDGPPLVFGVTPHSGPKVGGLPVTVLGYRLDAQGSGGTTVWFGESSVSVSSPSTSTTLEVLSPPALDTWGNPLGALDVTVDCGGSAATAERSYVPRPGLVSNRAPRPGGALDVTMHTEPSALVLLAYGVTIPGVGGLTLPGIEGTFRLLAETVLLPVVAADELGEARWQHPLAEDPTLIGLELQFQAFSASSTALELSNVLELVLAE